MIDRVRCAKGIENLKFWDTGLMWRFDVRCFFFLQAWGCSGLFEGEMGDMGLRREGSGREVGLVGWGLRF